MRIPVTTSVGSTPKKNIVAAVTGHRVGPDGKPVQIVGQELSTGKTVSLELTTMGHAASSASRLSVAQLINGFKVGKDSYRLEEGGIIALKSAFPVKGATNTFIGSWIDVLAYTSEASDDTVRGGPVSLSYYEAPASRNGDAGRASALVTWFDPSSGLLEAQPRQAAEMSRMKDGIRGFLEQAKLSHSFILRAVVPSADGKSQEIVAIEQMAARFQRAPGATKSIPMTLDEQVQKIWGGVQKMAEAAGPKGSVHALCSSCFSVSPASLNGPNSDGARKAWKALASKFETVHDDGAGGSYREIMARPAVFTLRPIGDGSDFVIGKVVVPDPYSPGLDPGLFNRSTLTYSSDLQAGSDEGAGASSEGRNGTSGDGPPPMTAADLAGLPDGLDLDFLDRDGPVYLGGEEMNFG